MKQLITLILLVFLVMSVTPSSTQAYEQESSVDLNEVDVFTNVVIFIRFADEVDYTAPHSLSYYNELFNGVDTVSLRDYYLDVSYGSLTIDSLLMGDTDILFYTDSFERSYYQPYDETTNPNGYQDVDRTEREHSLLKRAVDFVVENTLIAVDIDLDVNNDGDIDSLSFIISGEPGDWADLLWPHKWDLYTYYDFFLGEFKVDAPMINGAYAYSYTFELLGSEENSYRSVDVPVSAHETFHLLSAPDLYHYDRYDWIEPVGDWGLMESVTDIPSHMLGYMKYVYGSWIPTVNEIEEEGSYTIYPLATATNNLYRLDLGYDDEYLYFEYRDQSGTYEANTPQSGLLVYRVDSDYFNQGNANGYYSSDGETPADEVFVFRPGIDDTLAPITFAPTDNEFIDEDGIPDLAGLSNQNPYDAAGIGTDIPLFYSDGTLMDLTIENVVEHDGYVTFDIHINPPRVELVSEYTFPNQTNVRLLDVMGSLYDVSFVNVNDMIVYYTTDGSEPTTDATLYNGTFRIDATNHHVKAILVNDLGETIGNFEQDYTFVTTMETNHTNYGDLTQLFFVAQFEHLADYTIDVQSDSAFEDDSDRLRLFTESSISLYFDSNLVDLNQSRLDYGFVLEFQSNLDTNNDHGLEAELIVNQIFNGISFQINGGNDVTVEVNNEFIDEGLTLMGEGVETAYYTTSSNVNVNETGDYLVTYTIYDGNDEVIGTISRVVHVVDTIAPIIALIGEDTMTIEVFDTYTEPGVTITDNYNVSMDVIINGSVDTNVIGTYSLFYNVFDEEGNMSDIIARTVHVVDTVAPEATLQAGVDTIVVNQEWIDASILPTDNYDTEFEVEVISSTVDVTTPGTYTVLYRVLDSSGNYAFQTRYVTVVEPVIDTIVECDPGKTTYLIGDIFEPLDCMANGVSMTLGSELNMNIAGTKRMEYTATINGRTFIYYSYIFVLNDYVPDVVVWKDELEVELR